MPVGVACILLNEHPPECRTHLTSLLIVMTTTLPRRTLIICLLGAATRVDSPSRGSRISIPQLFVSKSLLSALIDRIFFVAWWLKYMNITHTLVTVLWFFTTYRLCGIFAHLNCWHWDPGITCWLVVGMSINSVSMANVSRCCRSHLANDCLYDVDTHTLHVYYITLYGRNVGALFPRKILVSEPVKNTYKPL